MPRNYWDEFLNKRLSRRRTIIAGAATAAAAAFISACGGGDDDNGANAQPTGTAAAGQPTAEASMPSVGGKLIWQGYGDPGGGLELIKTRNAGVYQMASLTHDALLDFAYGLPDYPGISVDVLPGLATALPEVSPDKLTVTFKIADGVKWHDGTDLTSEDVKWTYDTLAFAEESAMQGDYKWLESTEAPDPTTFVMHANIVNADLLQTIAFKNSGAILNQKHQESGDAENSFLGSGPFVFVEYDPPTLMRYSRNADYWNSDKAGWFDSIDRLGTSDSEKKVADIIAKQVDVTYWFPPEERKRILDKRDDLQVFQYPEPGGPNVYIRNDVAPFDDKRVRQALSMGFDRNIMINASTEGEGRPDQALSRTGEAWEFRGPEDLARADLFELNVSEAMKLLSAAQVTPPVKTSMPGWNATVIGQKWVDMATSVTTQWRSKGIADVDYAEETFGQFGPRFTGVYDTLQWGPNVTSTLPNVGISIKDKYYAGGSVPVAPTLNLNYVNNPEVDDLVSKQLEEFDREARIQLFRQLEDILAEDMVQIPTVTSQITYMLDPKVANAQMPRDAYNGSVAWMKYWYFGTA